jgi:hypothetical protein
MLLLLTLAAGLLLLAATLGITDPTIPGIQDVQLRLQASVTKTASFNSTALDLGSGFAPKGGGQPMQGIVPVTALDTTSGDETYAFKLQESDDNSTFTDMTPAVSATAVSTVACKGFVTKRYVRLVLTAAGTTPSITYGDAFLNPITL